MLLKTVFPHLRHFRVDSLVKEEQQITLVCVSTRKQAPCPSCQQISHRIHRQYDRTLADISFSGQRVVLRLRVHKFFCQQAACPRRIARLTEAQQEPPRRKKTVMTMWYPNDVSVPESLRTKEFLIRPLRATDVTLDYDAVVSSRAELWLQSGGSWPREGFTLEENLADLKRHEQEHQERIAFTYTLMNLTETVCLGCIYITPVASALERAGGSSQQLTEIGEREACVTFWVRQSRLADMLDTRLLQALIPWFKTEWTFTGVVFAARKTQERQIHLFEEAGMRLLSTLPRSFVYV